MYSRFRRSPGPPGDEYSGAPLRWRRELVGAGHPGTLEAGTPSTALAEGEEPCAQTGQEPATLVICEGNLDPRQREALRHKTPKQCFKLGARVGRERA